MIENDFQNTYHSAVPPCADTDALDADALIRRIREAGLVAWAAPRSHHIKANIGKVETLIANACECGPISRRTPYSARMRTGRFADCGCCGSC
ncbi:MAG: hypothetical protein ACLTYN_07310 [Dysosmobacter welbionis]